MNEHVPRLGDLIDDFCPRCRLLLNHAVAGLVESRVVKVVCQTCHSEHPYREGKVPPKKKPSPRAALFHEVLSKAAPAAPAEPTSEPDAPAPRKKRSVGGARYISRHGGKRPPKVS